MTAEQRLLELNITLPDPPVPAGLYSPVVQTGNLLFVSGQVPIKDGQVHRRGKLGENVTPEEGFECAAICALNALGLVRSHLGGSLDRVTKVVRLAGYVACAPAFIEHPKVVNGASQVMLDVFEDAGRHARIAIGVFELPFGVPVEVEFIFEVH
ncbi:MAG: RidA family protein [Dehalococcoidia bacterium]